MNSFKKMIGERLIKRADAMRIRLEDIHEESGFNLRIEDDDFAQSIEALAEHISSGGQYPALEVRPRAEGGVFIVDGHRRRKAIALALERGAPLADGDGSVWVSVVPFTGNDADRTARIITSAEGRELKPLETAEGYKRLSAFGWDTARIAKTVGKTRQHVEQMLLLATANSDVQKMVAAGQVSAAVAVDIIRQHGEEAGNILKTEAAKAAAQGKKKVTAGTIKGKPLPRPLVNRAVDAIDFLLFRLPSATHEHMTAIRDGHGDADICVQVNAGALYELVTAYQSIQDEREHNKDKAAALHEQERQASLDTEGDPA